MDLFKGMLEKRFPDGVIEANLTELAGQMGFARNTFVSRIRLLMNDGYLVLVKQAKQISRTGWTNPIYHIVHLVDNINSDEPEETAENITTKFHDLELKLVRTNKGLVMSVSDLSKAIKANFSSMVQLIKRNWELFECFVVAHPEKKTEMYLTREGVIAYLMKISIGRLSAEKKELVLAFQKWAVETLGEIIEKGKIQISDKEHFELQKGIREITGLSEIEVDAMFNNFPAEIIRLLKDTKVSIAKLEAAVKEDEETIRILKNAEQRATEKAHMYLSQYIQHKYCSWAD